MTAKRSAPGSVDPRLAPVHADGRRGARIPWSRLGRGCLPLHRREGIRYLDGVSSLCVCTNIHGHRTPHSTRAIRSQLDKIRALHALGVTHRRCDRLARQLCPLLALTRVFYSDDGGRENPTVEIRAQEAFQSGAEAKPRSAANVVPFPALGGRTGDRLAASERRRRRRGGSTSCFGPLLSRPPRSQPRTLPMPVSLRSESARTAGSPAFRDRRTESGRTPRASRSIVVEPMVQGAAGMIVHARGIPAGRRECSSRSTDAPDRLGRRRRLRADRDALRRCEQERGQPSTSSAWPSDHRRLPASLGCGTLTTSRRSGSAFPGSGGRRKNLY